MSEVCRRRLHKKHYSSISRSSTMDLASSPRSSLEWSLDDSSTCPTTPASSPLFRAAKVDDVSSHSTSPAGITDTQGAHNDAATANSARILANDRVKSVCVVGAGYVGRLLLAHCPYLHLRAKLSQPYRRTNRGCSRAIQSLHRSDSAGPGSSSHPELEVGASPRT